MGKKEDMSQNVNIARLEERFNALEKNVVSSMSRFENNLNNIIESFDKDKDNALRYVDEKFVTKEDVKPVLMFYRRMTDFSLGIILFVGAIGVAVIAYFSDFIKEKLR